MSRDLGVLKLNAALFPVKIEAEKVTKIKTVEIKEIEVSERQNLKIRFLP